MITNAKLRSSQSCRIAALLITYYHTSTSGCPALSKPDCFNCAAPRPTVPLTPLAGVLPQPGLPLPALAPPDLYLMAPEQLLPGAASVGQQQQQLEQQLEQQLQHRQSMPQQDQQTQQAQQQQQQQQRAGIAKHAQHGLGYEGEDFALPPLQGNVGGGGGFPQIGVGDHTHVPVR